MFAAALNSFWAVDTVKREKPARPKRLSTPVFIGDAVQPWNGQTMLLEIIRRDADRLTTQDNTQSD